MVANIVTEGHSSWQANYPASLPDTWCHPDHQTTLLGLERENTVEGTERAKRFKMDTLRPIQGQVRDVQLRMV